MIIKIAFAVAGAAAALALAPAAGADTTGTEGQPNATEEKVSGGPANSVGLVSTFSSILKDSGSSLGQHSAGFAPGQNNTDGGGATGRVGVGNLGRTDGLAGDDANSHFSGQLVRMGVDTTVAPGNTDNPNRQGNPNG